MKVFYLRHQAAGVIFDHPFMLAPTPEELAPVLARCVDGHGEVFAKTGEKYWAKVICVENGETTTIGCAHGGSAAAVDAKASGHCPIRASGQERSEPEPEHDKDARLKQEREHRSAKLKGPEYTLGASVNVSNPSK